SLGILPGFTGTLVHDSLALYNAYTGCAHQLCGAHLIGELTAAEQDHPGRHWPAQVRSALGELARHAGRVYSGQCERIEPGGCWPSGSCSITVWRSVWPSIPGLRGLSSPRPATC